MGTMNLDAALIAGRGLVLLRSPNTAGPTYAQILTLVSSGGVTLPAGTSHIGETDPADLPSWDKDGGDSEVMRTWWTESAREKRDPETKFFTVKLLQFDNDTMALFEGGGTFANPNEFISPTNPAAIEKGCTIIYADNGNVLAEDMARVSFRGEGTIEHSTDEWSKIPVKGTVLTPTAGGPIHRWLGEHVGTPA